MFKKTLGAAAVAALAATALPAFAQAEDVDTDTVERIEEDRETRYRDVTKIEFDGQEVVAGIVKPTGIAFNERPKADFNPLIELRADFNAEMDRSLSHIR